jgi:hypothetical protein
VYPRFELVEEYRSASSGRNLRLCTLHELLREMYVDTSVVAEVQKVEAANAAVAAITLQPVIADVRLILSGMLNFDYSTNNGFAEILTPEGMFSIRFSKGSDKSIRIYNTNLRRIARIKEPSSGQRVLMDALETSSRSYLIQLGEAFAAQNHDGRILVGRVTSIQDDTRGAAQDNVVVYYHLSEGPDFGVVP